MRGNTSAFFVFNSDVHCDFPLAEMLRFQQDRTDGNGHVILGRGANETQAPNYGCIVQNDTNAEVRGGGKGGVCVYVFMCVTALLSVLRCVTMWRSQSLLLAMSSTLECISLPQASSPS